MKRIALAVIAIIFIFAAADFSFAAYSFQVQGTVTKISGNQITIKDNQGQEISVAGNVSGLKTGDKVSVNVSVIRKETPRKLTAEEKDYLIKQCLVEPADVDIIPELIDDSQAIIVNGVTERNCDKLVPFKASREYYRKLGIDKKVPLPPAGWSTVWLTEKEFKNYLYIMDHAPW
ncbi:MAG TPA: hypothetical protein VMU29_02260 [Smithella sp.]|nr:hypothetical protein [Smithella sp.]